MVHHSSVHSSVHHMNTHITVIPGFLSTPLPCRSERSTYITTCGPKPRSLTNHTVKNYFLTSQNLIGGGGTGFVTSSFRADKSGSEGETGKEKSYKLHLFESGALIINHPGIIFDTHSITLITLVLLAQTPAPATGRFSVIQFKTRKKSRLLIRYFGP